MASEQNSSPPRRTSAAQMLAELSFLTTARRERHAAFQRAFATAVDPIIDLLFEATTRGQGETSFVRVELHPAPMVARAARPRGPLPETNSRRGARARVLCRRAWK